MIKLFVACHMYTPVPTHPLLQPIQVGTALAEKEFPGYLHDNKGENISALNCTYCELTGLYWAWKNVQADYYGLFHYRRYLYPDLHARLPYRLEKTPSHETLERLGYSNFRELIPHYDMIMPMGEDMHVSVREHYGHAPFHQARDLHLAEEILSDLQPSYIPAMEVYLSGSLQYFGNICIMNREILNDYCSWLFPVLEEFVHRQDLSDRSPQEKRAPGYLGERLLGIYYTHNRARYKTAELPRVHFMTGNEYIKQQIINTLLPPGSIIRSKVKKIKK